MASLMGFGMVVRTEGTRFFGRPPLLARLIVSGMI